MGSRDKERASATDAGAQPINARKQRVAEFVAWAGKHIKGDEKGEAQIFLDRLFQAYGQQGILEIGGTLEFRLRKSKEDGGGTAFADLVWKPYVLVEMKKRGEDLTRHYRQAFDYWVRLVPNRPHYVVLCNFDEFWVYDFETQMDTPKDRVPLAELPERNGALAFLSPVHETPVFAHDHVAVTRDAADKLAMCFNSLVAPNRKASVSRDDAQAFILQMLVALFAEDIGLLPQYTVTRLLDECKTPADTYDLLGGLFVAMNDPRGNPGGRYKGVAYFNGGLFAKPAQLELQPNELNLLRAAAEFEWSQVRPEIFGTLFEHSLGKEQRHAFGQHFTSPVDIMKIVGPTIVEPWREQIENASTLTQMNKLRNRMEHFTVLDPACGSGNFLYIAYRELKRLEKRLFERMEEKFPSEAKQTGRMSFLSAQNFHGMDISPFAIELAKVTMVIARKLAIDELHINESPLPLDNLDANFKAVDALIDAAGIPAQWPKTDVIIGNPPFLGAKLLKPQRGPDYVNLLRKAYPDVPGMADYCVYWFRKAHDQLAGCTADDPVAGRAGLVGTQNVRNNQSRVGGLDHIAKTGTIIEAVENQPWSGEANVHVSIVDWVKTQDAKRLPKKRRLWFKVEPPPGEKGKRKRGEGPASKDYELDFRECAHINSALSDEVDLAAASQLTCNLAPQVSFNGQMLGHKGFLLLSAQRSEILRRDPKSKVVIFPYLNGREVLSGAGGPERYVLDFGQRDQLKAAAFAGAFAWVRDHVLRDRERKAKEGVDRDGNMRPHHRAFLSRWWQLSFGRPELISLLADIPRYLCCSLVTKRPIFIFVDSGIRPSNLLQVFAFADDFTFGIVQSGQHWAWFRHKCSKLKSDFRFGEEVWNTFPWPQKPTKQRVQAVVKAGREVRRVRAEALKGIKGGLRALYRTLELPGKNPLKDAHAALDAAVLDAYGFSPRTDILSQLLALNLDVAARIERGEAVTAPGVPKDYPKPEELVTDDCVQAEDES
ncbi:MAG: N-6 DNA methylase [Planctomycetota bacterium]|nr:N-6 DNA methylase [Planctomycetota bacterium]